MGLKPRAKATKLKRFFHALGRTDPNRLPAKVVKSDAADSFANPLGQPKGFSLMSDCIKKLVD
ncbi:MAG: hypothetical protein SWZ49_19220 [Cyanobacteriota bacterium]|nr:hypothetical protein [Cyanobacteriota bacterium]